LTTASPGVISKALGEKRKVPVDIAIRMTTAKPA